MKMVMAIMARDEAERVLRALVAAKYTATYMETRGGMLRQAQMTLFTAVEKEDLDTILSLIEDTCRSEVVVEAVDEEEAPAPMSAPMPAKPRLGGAVVFVWDIERSETY
jgi:uncharacterized protein YaaQ